MLSSIAVTSEPREGEGYTGDGMPSRNTKAGISRHRVATFGLRGLELLEVYKLLENQSIDHIMECNMQIFNSTSSTK
jgi:hypothetical protein